MPVPPHLFDPPVIDVDAWPRNSPEGIFLQCLEAFVQRDGRALATLSTAASLNAYRDVVRASVTPRQSELSIDTLRASHPGMPDEALRWHFDELRAHREGTGAQLLRSFRGVPSLEALLRLDAPELLHRALQGAPRGATAFSRVDVLGHVLESSADELRAHVLSRTWWPGPEGDEHLWRDEPDLATLQQTADGWRLQLDALSPFAMAGFRGVLFLGEYADSAEAGAE